MLGQGSLHLMYSEPLLRASQSLFNNISNSCGAVAGKLYEKNVGNNEGLDIDTDLGEEESEDTFGDTSEGERNG